MEQTPKEKLLEKVQEALTEFENATGVEVLSITVHRVGSNTLSQGMIDTTIPTHYSLTLR
jgi:hypothetical protein